MDATLTHGAALIGQLLMGISLAACAGLRAFLPLLVVGVAGRLDWIPLTRTFEWLESWPALIVFGTAVIAEVLADKIPVVDNFLDLVEGLVKPVAGAVLVASVLTELSPLQATVAGIVAGASAAGAMHLTKAKVRVLSSSTTAGVANPIVSLFEDVVAVLGTVAAMIAPLVAILALAGGLAVIWFFLRRLKRALSAPEPPAQVTS